MGDPERMPVEEHGPTHASERAKALRREERSTRDDAILAAAGAVLGISLDVGETARAFATFVVQTAHLGDACNVDILRAGAPTQRHLVTVDRVESSDIEDSAIPGRPTVQEQEGKTTV